MSERPILSLELKVEMFLQCYYLKEELILFCKDNLLSTAGCKQEITKRIECFLRTGQNLREIVVKKKNGERDFKELSLNSIIEDDFVCSEKIRDFFKLVIGENFSFNVIFQKYLKNNAGKTYLDAVNEWHKIQQEKKLNKGHSNIDSQFEYNTYIRDFFNDNKDRTLKEAIECWKFKKGIIGHNKYESKDLEVLEKNNM